MTSTRDGKHQREETDAALSVVTPVKKKQRLSEILSQSQDSNLDSIVSQVRQESRDSLSSPAARIIDDRGFLLRNIQAILSTNKDIWNRCQSDMVSAPPFPSDSKIVFKQTFYRTVSVVSDITEDNSTNIYFQTQPELTLREFKRPPLIPSELTDVIAVKKKHRDVFPDYDAFLKSCLLLHDDVLMPFLMKFKDHLEEVQVFLGEIENWLMEPFGSIDFIQETFDIELQFSKDECGCKSCDMKHDDSAICMECYKTYAEHQEQYRRRREFYGSVNGLRKQTPSSDIEMGHFCSFYRKSASFFMPKPQSLRTARAPTGSLFQHEFDIKEEEGKESLHAFFQFLSTCIPIRSDTVTSVHV